MSRKDPRPKGLVTFHRNKNQYGGVLPVPSAIAQLVPDRSKFTCKLTDEGLLFRPYDPSEPAPPVAVPEWLQNLQDTVSGI